MLTRFGACLAALFFAACSGHTMNDAASEDVNTSDSADVRPPLDVPPEDVQPHDATPGTWCVHGGDVTGAILQPGFCMRRFAGAPDHTPTHSPVPEPRTLSFAPNGDLFVSSPASSGAGGGTGRPDGSPGAILVLTDDDHDGVAEVHHFIDSPMLNDVHGLAVAPDNIYFTANGAVMRTPYAVGQRAAQMSGGAPVVQTVGTIPSIGRWTHALVRTHGGTLYVSNAASATTGTCPDPGSGYIARMNSDGSITHIANGFRNPMYMRCHPTDEVCFATELGEDGGESYGAREKLLFIHPTTNYGYPCCATTGMPAPGYMSCDAVTTEEVHFTLNDTPFGMDWEMGMWPPPYGGVMCVAKHGSFYSFPSWQGTGVFCAPTNPTTHAPSGAFSIFVDGWGSQHMSTGQMYRATDLAFSPDGRMFVSDDIANEIYWIAPTTLPGP